MGDRITITVFPKYFLYVLLYTSGCLGTCVCGVTNCVMQKRVLVQLLHGQVKDVTEQKKYTQIRSMTSVFVKQPLFC